MSHELRTVIIDDEPDAIEQLKKMLATFQEFDIVETFQETTNLFPFFKNAGVDLLFLDIQMPGQNGIEFLKELSTLHAPPKVVMVTAFEQHMLHAFRNSAFDYLLKPIERLEFSECIKRVINETRKPIQNFSQLFASIQNKVRIPGVYETHFLAPDEIFYLKADGRYTDVHLINGKKLTTTINLGKISESLQSEIFQRISRTVIVNTQYLNKLDHKEKTCTLKVDGLDLKLGFSKRYFQ